MRLSDDRRMRIRTRYEPVVISVEWTEDLYRSVTVSVAPGRRLTCIVGPRGATEAEATQAALDLVAYISE